MKNSNCRKMFNAVTMATALTIVMTGCGNSKTNVPDEKPIDTTITDTAYEEETVETEVADTTAETTTAEATETVAAESKISYKNNGSNVFADYPEIKKPNSFSGSFCVFEVEKGSKSIGYSLLSSVDFDDVTGDKHLNYYGDFTKIEGETYNGYLTEIFGFEGQSYWLRGEGSHKCHIETNDNNEVVAIAFSDMHDEYTMRFAETIKYTDSDTVEMAKIASHELTILEKFNTTLMDNTEAVTIPSSDGKAEIIVYNDRHCSAALEVVHGGGRDGGDALKTIMLYKNDIMKQKYKKEE